VIAVNQDPLGREAKRVWKDGELEVWAKPMSDGSRAVLLLNRGAGEAEIAVPWTTLAYPEHLSASVRDLWAHKDLGKIMGKFSAKVASHDVLVVTVRP
jgi:alpha-galactosidase